MLYVCILHKILALYLPVRICGEQNEKKEQQTRANTNNEEDKQWWYTLFKETNRKDNRSVYWISQNVCVYVYTHMKRLERYRRRRLALDTKKSHRIQFVLHCFLLESELIVY